MKRLILAVDDEQEVLNSIRQAVRDLGNYDLLVSESGEDAINAIRKKSPDLVISAIDIDYIDGLDIIKEAKKNSIPSIILTSRIDEETVGMITAYYKPNFYMKKPLDRLELIKNIKSLFISREDKIEGIPPDKIEVVLKGICDSIEQGIAIIDRSFNIVWINKALEKKGFLFKNVIGRKSYHVFDNAEGPGQNSPTLQAFQNKEVNKAVKKGNDGHDYRITSIPVKDNAGDVVYVIEFGEDLTKP